MFLHNVENHSPDSSVSRANGYWSTVSQLTFTDCLFGGNNRANAPEWYRWLIESTNRLIESNLNSVLWNINYACLSRYWKWRLSSLNPVFIPGAHIIKTYRHSPTYKIQITKFLGRKRKLKKKFLKGASNFSVREWKPFDVKVVEQYCWALTQRAGQPCCVLVGLCISTGLRCVNIRSWPWAYEIRTPS